MKFLLAGYFGFGNFGDEAILKYAIDILSYYYKDAEIEVITQSPYLAKKQYGIKGIYRFDLGAVFCAIKNCDYLIFPGGSVLQDITSVKSIIYYLSLIFLAKVFKKKVLMISQGIGPINNPVAQKLTYKILKKVDFITVRDEKSYQTLLNNDIASELTSDMLWAFTQKQKEKEPETNIVFGDIACNSDKPKVGIQLRNWADLTEEKLEVLAKNVLKAFPRIEFNYKLISLQKNSDEIILIKFGEIMHKIQPKADIELCRPESIEETVDVLQSMDYMLAMRFHAGLCTINAEKPLLMLSYDPKTEEFCHELGLDFLNIKELSDENLMKKIKWLKEFNPTKTALKTNILANKSRQNVDLFVKELEKWV